MVTYFSHDALQGPMIHQLTTFDDHRLKSVQDMHQNPFNNNYLRNSKSRSDNMILGSKMHQLTRFDDSSPYTKQNIKVLTKQNLRSTLK